MRVLVLGRNGQVGHELARAAWPSALEPHVCDRTECDITDAAAVDRVFAAIGPEIVINVAAYTAVDRAEQEPAQALAVNRDGTANLARAAADQGAAMLHVSTDYVFDGSKATPWVETDPVAPLGSYGASKEEGERVLREVLPRHVILRTAWVFGAHGANFVRTIHRVAQANPKLRVVADQFGGPTPARDIAATLIRMAEAVAADKAVWGTFHYAGAPTTSWHGFAEAIVRLSGLTTPVEPIATVDWPTPARRPANSRLDCRKIGRSYGIAPPSWEAGLADVLAEWGALAP
ncbi:MAG TPA: dTDP-4-dehydrorhamnose reductase [Stellaceae bacterium]|nr:dTDP-4-dehydrorhamnose reductase [Stellaceae bacterium]